jgi:hypothetical protein
MRDLHSAIRFAKRKVGRNEWNRMCQGLARTAIGVPPFGRSASIAWETCRDRGWGVAVDGDTVIPAGSIVYYSKTVKFNGHDPTVGHATFCVKTGTVNTAVVVSNDVGANREIGAVHPAWFRQHWNMGVRGYIVRCPFGRLPIDGDVGHPTPDVPDVPDVPEDAPGVQLSNLVPGASGPDVAELQQALIDNGYVIPAGVTGNYKDQTIAAVRAAQLAQGLVGPDADGAVGRKTCLFLGLTVVDEAAQPKDMPLDLIPGALGIDADQQAEFWEAVDAASTDDMPEREGEHGD